MRKFRLFICLVILLLLCEQTAHHSENTFIAHKNEMTLCDFSFCRKIPDGRYVDVRKPPTFSNFRPYEETVFIVHGFNGTARDKHMRYLKDGN